MEGNLGNGTTVDNSLTAVAVNGNRTYIGIASGLSHSCAVADDGIGWCWGDGAFGPLGNGGDAVQTSPVQVAGGLLFRQIDASSNGRVSCGLATTGLAYCWGSNSNSGLGIGPAGTFVLTPQPVAGGRQYVQLTVGTSGGCALQQSGQAWCWGNGLSGQLGNGAILESSVPVAVIGDHQFVELGAGSGNYCGRKADGSVWCWGFNGNGQIGDGTTVNRSVPTRVVGGHNFVALGMSGAVSSCALTASGDAYCWGNGGFGMLGTGNQQNSNVPVLVLGGHTFLQLTGGAATNCGFTITGVYCWGSNTYGNIGNNTQTHALVPTMVIGMP